MGWTLSSNLCACKPEFYVEKDVCKTCVVDSIVDVLKTGCTCTDTSKTWSLVDNECESANLSGGAIAGIVIAVIVVVVIVIVVVIYFVLKNK
jgi:hypothetical protein